MKVTFSPINFQKQNYQPKSSQTMTDEQSTVENIPEYSSTQAIPFGSIYGVKPKKIDTLAKKFDLVRYIEGIVSEASQNTIEFIFEKLCKEIIEKQKRTAFKKLDKVTCVEDIDVADFFTHILSNCLTQMTTALTKAEEMAKRAEDNTTDYELLNKLKNALLNNNLRLGKIFEEHYAQLSQIQTLEELAEAYPKIKIPKSPTEVISKRIAECLPREFFIKMDKLADENDNQGIENLFRETFDSVIAQISAKTNKSPEFFERLFEPTCEAMGDRYLYLFENLGFASLPESKKMRPIAPDEIKLLSIDFDKFVLHTLREQYLNNKKLSEIVYKEGDVVIKPNSLGSIGYKFEKVDERVKKIIKDADRFQAAERDYDHFDSEELKAKIKEYSLSEISNNDKILERLIDFNDSKLLDNDKTHLKRFLQILDDISDGKISIEEGVRIIEKENLRPIDTEKLNETEKARRIAMQKAEQKAAAQFQHYCDKFDESVDSLYKSQLDSIANICSLYRPKHSGVKTPAADKIIELIKAHTSADGIIIKPEILETKIKYLDKYFSLEEVEPNNPLLKKAIQYATKGETIDEIKAGQYIKLYETLETYPASSSFLTEADSKIISAIKQRTDNNEEAVLTLLKYDNYKLAENLDELQLTRFLPYFDMSADIDKGVIEAFIKNVYSTRLTKVTTYLTPEKTASTQSIMTPSAKAKIIDKKRFPLCIEYFKEFESKMTKVAQRKEEDGIHTIGSNNKVLRKKYKQEVKISYDERLYSTEGGFIFDDFGPGFHKLKNTKA